MTKVVDAKTVTVSQLAWTWTWRSLLIVGVLVAGGMAGCPAYNVYEQRMEGEAVLARANSAKLVLVTQAEAEREAAVKRAEAISIVGKAATDFPAYRTQEFIGAFAEALHEGKITQIIYVPTEGNIPILEAGKGHR